MMDKQAINKDNLDVNNEFTKLIKMLPIPDENINKAIAMIKNKNKIEKKQQNLNYQLKKELKNIRKEKKEVDKKLKDEIKNNKYKNKELKNELKQKKQELTQNIKSNELFRRQQALKIKNEEIKI